MSSDPGLEARLRAYRERALAKPQSDTATLDQVNKGWLPSIMDAVAAGGVLKNEMQPDHEQEMLNRISSVQHARDLNIAGSEAAAADMEKKMAMRNLVTVGGMAAVPAAAPAGIVGGAAAGASVGAGLGLAEGALGDYTPEETGSLVTWGAGAGGFFGAAAPLLAAGVRSIAVLREMKAAISKGLLSPADAQSATMWADQVAAIRKAQTPKQVIDEGKAALREAANNTRRIMRRISLKEFLKNPEAQHVVMRQMPKGNYDDMEAVYQAAKDQELIPFIPRKLKSTDVPRMQSEIARDAFKANLGPREAGPFYSQAQVARAAKAARMSAADYTRQEIGAALKVATTAQEARGLAVMNPQGAAGLARGVYVKAFEDVGTMLGRHKQIFGEVGQDLKVMLRQFANLEDALVGNWTRLIQNVTKKLNTSELENLHEVIHNGANPYNQKVAGAATKWRLMAQRLAQYAREANLHEVDRGMTVQFSRMNETGQQKLLKIMKVVEEGGDYREFLPELKPKEADLLGDMVRNRAKVTKYDGGPLVYVPFREMQNYAPKYFTPDVIAQATKDPQLLDHMRQALAEYNPKWLEATKDEIIREASSIAGGNVTAGAEFRGGGLQWSREGLLPDKYMVRDPRVYLGKYVHDAARRIASAHVFGGRDEMFQVLMERMKLQNAASLNRKLVPTGVPQLDIAGRSRTPENEEIVRNVLYTAIGRGHETGYTMRMLNNLATIRYIGFSSMLKQFGALFNVAGSYGLDNTLVSLFKVVEDPRVKQILDDTGVTAFDLPHTIIDQGKTAKVARGIYKYTGLVNADRLVRRVAGTAAALRADHAASQLESRIPMIRDIAQRDLINLGISPGDIVGGKLSRAQLRQAALQGAVQTQFTGRVHELPYFATTPQGKAAYFLKRFSIQQTNFLLNKALPEAAKGNMRPLLDSLAMLGISTAATGGIVAAISSKNYDLAMNLIGDAIWGSVGNLSTDVWNSPKDAPGRLLGPGIGVMTEPLASVVETGKAAVAAAQGDEDAAVQHLGSAGKALVPNSIVQMWRLAVRGANGN